MKSQVFKKNHQSGQVELNMIPIVDVAFVLILFFILTGQIVSANFQTMKLADPAFSVAKKLDKNKKQGELYNRVIVNVVCRINPLARDADPEVTLEAEKYVILDKTYVIGDTKIGPDQNDLRLMTQELKLQREKARKDGYSIKDFVVEVRADSRVAYRFVEPVLQCAADAGIPKMNITSMVSKDAE